MKEMNFIHLVSLMPVSTQIGCALSVVFSEFIPAIAYGTFLILVAIGNGQIVSALCVAGSLVLLLASFSLLLHHRIGSIESEARISFFKKWIDNNFEKSFIQFFVEWLSRNQPGLIILTKLFACALLYAVCQLYKYDEYDYRLLALGCLAAFEGSMVIAHQYVLFENHHFQMLRNLPIGPGRRMVNFVLCILFLSLPEIILLLRVFPDQLPAQTFIELIVFVISLLVMGYVVLLALKNNLEQFSGRVFIAFMLLVLIILWSVSLYILAAVAIGISVLMYRKVFYEFEVIEKESGTKG